MVTINSDAPITSKSDDKLGYAPFSRALAQALASRTGDGFVIGIQAAWGMGKSSAINLALEAVAELEAGKPSAERTKVRHFNPWLFSGLEALVRGYLSELGRIIDETMGQGTPQGTRKVVERLIKGGAEMVGGAAALGAVYLSGGAAIPIAASIKSGVTGAMNFGAHVLDNRSLDTMIAELREHLTGIGSRLVIVLDDLDRLQPDELRQILTLVKTFGNLPNVTHLLVYDRAIVDAALGPARPDQPSFREKIVQVELDLPPPARSGLRAMTVDRLIAILGPEPAMAQADWWEVTRVAFSRHLRTPRDVARLTNALSVGWPSVAGEAYVPDFVAIEVLRHFERPTYEALREERDFLTGMAMFLPQAERDARRARIIGTISETARRDVEPLLARMFPSAMRGGGFGQAADGANPPAFSGRRIGDPKGFDAYFTFAASPYEISIAELRTISEHLSDAEFMRMNLREARGRLRPDGTSLAGQLLDELLPMTRRLVEVPLTLLEAILQEGDALIERGDEARDFFTIDNERRLDDLLEEVTRKIPQPGRAASLLACLTSPDASPHTAALLAARLAQQHGLVWQQMNDARHPPAISREEAEGIGRAVVGRIAELAASGRLRSRPLIGVVLRLWSVFGDPDQVRHYVASRVDDPSTLPDMVLANMATVRSSSEPYRYRELREAPDRTIFDLAQMAAAVERLPEGTEEHRDDLARFVRQARRLLSSGEAQEHGED